MPEVIGEIWQHTLIQHFVVQIEDTDLDIRVNVFGDCGNVEEAHRRIGTIPTVTSYHRIKSRLGDLWRIDQDQLPRPGDGELRHELMEGFKVRVGLFSTQGPTPRYVLEHHNAHASSFSQPPGITVCRLESKIYAT
jgi:hypothetical protein